MKNRQSSIWDNQGYQFLLLFLLFIFTVPINTQAVPLAVCNPEPNLGKQPPSHLVIIFKDNSRIAFHLLDEPILCYKNGKLVITSPSSITELDVDRIKKLSYENITSGIEEIERSNDSEIMPFIQTGESLTFFPDGRDLRIQVVTIGGHVVQSFNLPKGYPETVHLSALQPGIYMIVVNETTYKIIIR